jgi:hypothetical protein
VTCHQEIQVRGVLKVLRHCRNNDKKNLQRLFSKQGIIAGTKSIFKPFL